MALATPCQTSGSVFKIHTSPKRVVVDVEIPWDNTIDLTEDEAKILEANLHNAVELALAPYFKK